MKARIEGALALGAGAMCATGAICYGINVEVPLTDGTEFMLKSLGIIVPMICTLPLCVIGIEKISPTNTHRNR